MTPREWTALRHAAKQADEMGIVDMEIDGRPAAPRGIGDLAPPIGLRHDAIEVGRPQPTVTPRLDRLQGEREFGHERQHLADHQQLPGIARGGHHGIGFLNGQSDRLLDQNGFPGTQGLDGHPAVEVARHAEVDQVDLRIRGASPHSRHTGPIPTGPSACRAGRNCPECSSSRPRASSDRGYTGRPPSHPPGGARPGSGSCP